MKYFNFQKGIASIIAVIILGVIFVCAASYFGFVQKYCEKISPPKIGEEDSRIINIGGKIYFCQTFFDKLKEYQIKR